MVPGERGGGCGWSCGSGCRRRVGRVFPGGRSPRRVSVDGEADPAGGAGRGRARRWRPVSTATRVLQPGLGAGQPGGEVVEGGGAARRCGPGGPSASRAALPMECTQTIAVALGGGHRRGVVVPDLVGVAEAAPRPAARLGPVGLVGLDPVAERSCPPCGCGAARSRTGRRGAWMWSMVSRLAQLGVGDVEEVGAAEQRDQAVPGGDVGGVVGGVAVGDPVGDRAPPRRR